MSTSWRVQFLTSRGCWTGWSSASTRSRDKLPETALQHLDPGRSGAAGGPPNPLDPNAPTHEDWDAVREDPALAARLALYDPDEDDEPPAQVQQHRQTRWLLFTPRAQPEARQKSTCKVIGSLILGEEADQPSSPEEELIDNQPLLDPEPDWEQGGTEAVVQNAEEDAVQNSPRLSALGLGMPPLSARNPIILTPAVPGYPTIRHDRAGVWQLVAAQQSGSAARGALSSGSRTPPPKAEDPLPISEAVDPHKLPLAARLPEKFTT